MTPAFWLCLLLVIASGLSAYIGNEWGRKLGKRKLSIFRMRPKHSSTFATVLLSMCLSLGLMGALFTLMPSLQTAFFTPVNRDAEQAAFEHYENALQLANARLQRLSQEERSENTVQSNPVIPSERLALAIETPAPIQADSPTAPDREQNTDQNTASPLKKPLPAKRARRPLNEPSSQPQRPQPQTTAPPIALASRPERVTESRLEGRRIQRSPAVATPATSVSPSSAPTSQPQEPLQRQSLQAQTVAALPNYPKGALFELTVNGELNDAESAQLRQGIQRLTKDYLNLLGIQEEALQFKSAQIQQEMVKLSASGQYRLQIALSPSQNRDIPVNVSVSMLSESTTSLPDSDAFDPQLLLEEQRLQSSSTRQTLQQDLQAVLQKHAKQQQVALKIAPPSPGRTRSVQLPFEILNVVNQNGVIRGELFLR